MRALAHVVEPPDNQVEAPDDSLRARRPAYLDRAPLFGVGALTLPSPTAVGEGFRALWSRHSEPDAYVHQDPYTGAMIRVAQAVRRTAFKPLALSCSLHFGDAEGDPQAAYQLKRAIEGLADAAKMFGLPVLATELTLEARVGLWPDVVVAAHGVEHDAAVSARSDVALVEPFTAPGDIVAVVGRMTDDLSGSLLLDELRPGAPSFPPPIDLIAEGRMLEALRSSRSLLHSACDIGRGGLLVTLARCCGRGLGVRAAVPDSWQPLLTAGALFGEAQSRFLVALPAGDYGALDAAARPLGVPLDAIGTVGGQRLAVEGLIDISLKELEEWQS